MLSHTGIYTHAHTHVREPKQILERMNGAGENTMINECFYFSLCGTELKSQRIKHN